MGFVGEVSLLRTEARPSLKSRKRFENHSGKRHGIGPMFMVRDVMYQAEEVLC
jgi:hypothetical protein